ncbi:unnamed protein product [Durusdinium trenchii]|uniref:Uncharacterized protein n=1 Tax=Durusdinium trenchii TaxID=1381693 RepID=A0ABP0JDZ5_9DINO
MMAGTGLLASKLGSLTPSCKLEEQFDLDEPLPDFPECKAPLLSCESNRDGGDDGETYIGMVLTDYAQPDLKSPRPSYLCWQMPEDMSSGIPVAPNRLLHEILI